LLIREVAGVAFRELRDFESLTEWELTVPGLARMSHALD
jgi:hypothetical protein